MVCDVIGYHEEATSKQHKNLVVPGFHQAEIIGNANSIPVQSCVICEQV